MKRFLSRSIPALAVLALALPVHAEQLAVSAKVKKSCQVNATLFNLAMADFDPIAGTGGAGNADVNVFCSKGTTFKVNADSANGGANGFLRSVINGSSEKIGYELKVLGGAELPVGTDTGVGGYTGSGKNFATPVNFVATLAPAAADATFGDYSDTVTLTFVADP